MKRKTRVRLAKFQRLSVSVAKRLAVIIIGSILMAISYNALIIPHKLLSGGVGGLSLILKYEFGFPFYLGYLLFNIPIFLWGLKEINKKFIIYSIVGTLALTIAQPITKNFIVVPKDIDLFLASIFSGVVGGFGSGIILRAGASTGGTDIIAMIMKKKANIAIGSFGFYFNVVVLTFSLFLFNIKIALYTAISMWVSGRIVNYVLEGLNHKKSITIISEKGSAISSRIMKEVHRGVTYLDGHGAFTGTQKTVINTVVNNFESARIREIVHQTDPAAFMFITDVVEAAGRGFTVPARKVLKKSEIE